MVRAPGAASAARRKLALVGQLDQMESEIAALLMTELVNNSVQHAGARAGDLLELDVSITAVLIRVAVADGGSGFTPGDYVAGRRPTTAHWGLQLVDSLADRWGIDTAGGTAVWFEIDRGSTPQPR